jgi:hypothetical protein
LLPGEVAVSERAKVAVSGGEAIDVSGSAATAPTNSHREIRTVARRRGIRRAIFIDEG